MRVRTSFAWVAVAIVWGQWSLSAREASGQVTQAEGLIEEVGGAGLEVEVCGLDVQGGEGAARDGGAAAKRGPGARRAQEGALALAQGCGAPRRRDSRRARARRREGGRELGKAGRGLPDLEARLDGKQPQPATAESDGAKRPATVARLRTDIE